MQIIIEKERGWETKMERLSGSNVGGNLKND